MSNNLCSCQEDLNSVKTFLMIHVVVETNFYQRFIRHVLDPKNFTGCAVFDILLVVPACKGGRDEFLKGEHPK